MQLEVTTKCPYCQHINNVTVELKQHQTERVVVLCDIDSGGCDKYFVLEAYIEVKTESYKIEGKE
jgi:transcription elongation factor Elf1